MASIVTRIKPLFSGSSVITDTTTTGQKYCRILGKGNHLSQTKPIAFLISDERNRVEEFILTNTLRELSNHLGYLPEAHILSGHSSILGQRSCLKHVARSSQNYSAIISLSDWMTAGAAHHLTMSGVFAPVLFANVPTSTQEALAKHTWMNGVGTQIQNYQRQLTTIRDLLPDLRRLLIPHDILLHGAQNSSIKNGNIKSLIDECDRQNLETVMMSMPPENKLSHDIRQYRGNETLFVLTREGSVTNQMDAIIRTCNSHRMPIFSDLPLPTLNGAAFGSGTSGVQIAQPLAEMIYQIMEQERTPGSLQSPIVDESDLLLYNNINFAQQGINISDSQLRLLEAQHIMLYAQNQQML